MNFNKYLNKKFYFLGIGGISMYAIALLLQSKGAIVSGYDKVESDTTKFLSENGIQVFYDSSIDNSKGADYCICTAAIGEENFEYRNVMKNGIPIIYRGEFLGEIISLFNNSVGISGTHGKSTTSGILSEIFMADKQRNPSILMGAILPSINSAYRIGSAKDLIFEACEYKDSFLSFKPKISILLNVSLDHTDYFENLDRMKESFIKYISGTEKAVVNMDCADALDCANQSKTCVITYSTANKDATYYAESVAVAREKTLFDLYSHGEKLYSFELYVPGKHNLSNALAAIAAAIESSIPLECISEGLKNFKGIKRRFEFLGKINGAYIYDDYAHHPDEILATLSSAQSLVMKKIVCVFQPHTYTRLKHFFDDFVKIFNQKIKEYNFIPVFLPTYAAREYNYLGYDTEKLSLAVEGSLFIDSLESAARYIEREAKDDELYILMGAGDVSNISKLLKFDN